MRTLLLLTVFLSSATSSIAQKQGILGQVFWVSGNQMPSPAQKPPTSQQGIVREIYVYHAVNVSHVQRQGYFFSVVDAVLVTTIQSNADGTFKIKLPPGKYSLFTKEKDGLFANLLDGQGCVNCVSVKNKKYSWITITVDYEAAY